MAHVKPHWDQPSHPEVQQVYYGGEGFTNKSVSRVNLPPFGLFAKLSFPPCDVAEEPTYATVQAGRNKHINLNSDLLYINHSCDPSLIFDTGNLNVIAGPKGLQTGEELTFFYPSTEWHMSQPFDCLCQKPSCRGNIRGARDMGKERMEGMWINGHIRELLEEYESQKQSRKEEEQSPGQSIKAAGKTPENGVGLCSGQSSQEDTATGTPDSSDPTAVALKHALSHAEKVVAAARIALQAYMDQQNQTAVTAHDGNHAVKTTSDTTNVVSNKPYDEVPAKVVAGSEERGVTSRELSGEMGGDTSAIRS